MSAEDAAVSFAPRVSTRTRVLVLGSMPGRRSLEIQQYYGHGRNRLWPLLADLLGFDARASYDERMLAALDAGVGFWDVLKFCERPGSLDAAIRRSTEVPNDLPTLLREHPGIRAIALNGARAATSFDRHLRPLPAEQGVDDLAVLELPSTSPANAAVPYDRLRERWEVVASYVDFGPSRSTYR
jgi:TDG/mug DNA glycosylase family protein